LSLNNIQIYSKHKHVSKGSPMTNDLNSISPEQRLNKIVEDGMCIGCGICEPIAGSDKIQVKKSDKGMLIPHVVGSLDHKTVDRVYDVCPGTRVEGLPEDLIDANTQDDLIWGPYQKIVLAWASDKQTRFKGSTGGLLTALGEYLLATNRVDFILHAKASKTDPSFGEVNVTLEVEKVIEGAGSRYGPTAALVNITEILDKGQPFAYIGLPCDISALRNFADHDPRVDELIRYWLTPVCGGFMQTDSLYHFLTELGIDSDKMTAIRYRGYGCPGPTRVEFKDGSAIEKRYQDFWGEDDSAWNLPHRCKVCPDGIGESADIAASDTWPGGGPDTETEDNDPGTNAAIVRSAKGLELLEEAVAAGFVSLGDIVDPRYMDRVQPHQVRKKLTLKARYDGQKAAGNIIPKTTRLRLDQLYDANDPNDNRDQFEGARRRAIKLKNSN